MAAPEAWFRNLTLHSLLSGACAFVPLPWLDDHFLGRIRERQVRDWAKQAGCDLREIEVKILAGSERDFQAVGCLLGALAAAAWRLGIYLVRKVVRKLLFFLMFKEATDLASATFHEGYLLRTALRSRGPAGSFGTDEAWRIRGAIEAACTEVDTRPIHQILRRALRGSRALISWAARLGRTDDEERLGRWKQLVDTVSGALWEQEGYLEALDRRFSSHLGSDASEPPSTPGTI